METTLDHDQRVRIAALLQGADHGHAVERIGLELLCGVRLCGGQQGARTYRRRATHRNELLRAERLDTRDTEVGLWIEFLGRIARRDVGFASLFLLFHPLNQLSLSAVHAPNADNAST